MDYACAKLGEWISSRIGFRPTVQTQTESQTPLNALLNCGFRIRRFILTHPV